MTLAPPDELTNIADAMMAEAYEEAKKRVRARKFHRRFEKWQGNPVGFGEQVLGETYTDPIKEVMRSVVSNRVTIARSSNSTGKSHALARVAVWFYLAYPGAKVFTTAAPPLENLKNIMWGEIMGILNHHPQLFMGDKLTTMRIERGPSQFVTGIAIPTSGSAAEREAKFSGKHGKALLFIVDEGDAVPEEVYRGIESCMTSDFARLLIAFNPRDRIGPVYDKEKSGGARVIPLTAFQHPNVITGQNVIPGAVDRATTLRRINEWTRPMAPGERVDDETFAVPPFLVGTTTHSPAGIEYPPLPEGMRKVVDNAFYYMVLGEYPAQSEHQLIAEQWVTDARARWDLYVAQYGETPPMGTTGILGVDVAELGADANAAVQRWGGFVSRVKRWNGLDIHTTAQIVANEQVTRNCELAMVDGDGVGAGVAPAVDRANGENYVAYGVKVSSKPLPFIKAEQGDFNTLRDQLWWAVREWLRNDPGAMLPPDKMLLEELLVPTYKVSDLNGRIQVMRKDDMRKYLKRSPDSADALCFTFAPYRRAKVMFLEE